MNQQSRLRRMGWIAALSICTALYMLLHLKVNAVRSDVIRAERQIVQLQRQKLMLETEFATRSNQLQLAKWNRVDFGFSAPAAEQFIDNERELNSFGSPRKSSAPQPIRVAGLGAGEEAPPFPKLVSPLTGKPIDERLLQAEGRHDLAARHVAGPMRIELSAVIDGTAR